MVSAEQCFLLVFVFLVVAPYGSQCHKIKFLEAHSTTQVDTREERNAATTAVGKERRIGFNMTFIQALQAARKADANAAPSIQTKDIYTQKPDVQAAPALQTPTDAREAELYAASVNQTAKIDTHGADVPAVAALQTSTDYYTGSVYMITTPEGKVLCKITLTPGIQYVKAVDGKDCEQHNRFRFVVGNNAYNRLCTYDWGSCMKEGPAYRDGIYQIELASPQEGYERISDNVVRINQHKKGRSENALFNTGHVEYHGRKENNVYNIIDSILFLGTTSHFLRVCGGPCPYALGEIILDFNPHVGPRPKFKLLDGASFEVKK